MCSIGHQIPFQWALDSWRNKLQFQIAKIRFDVVGVYLLAPDSTSWESYFGPFSSIALAPQEMQRLYSLKRSISQEGLRRNKRDWNEAVGLLKEPKKKGTTRKGKGGKTEEKKSLHSDPVQAGCLAFELLVR